MISLFLPILVYLYLGFALMNIAKKTNTKPLWLSWIPLFNLCLIAKIAKMSWWPIIFLLIAYSPSYLISNYFLSDFPTLKTVAEILFLIFFAMWNWKMFERLQKPRWWSLSLLFLLPRPVITGFLGFSFWEWNWREILINLLSVFGFILYFIFLGIAAWGGTKKEII